MSNLPQDAEIDEPIGEGQLEKKYRLFKEKQNKIDMKLILKTSVSSNVAASLSEEDKVDVLIALKVIHLEWLNIKTIQNLDVFTNLETLYLQHNEIETIENLDMLINLEYLALNNNRIKRIENINHLRKLAFLSLSENLIEDFDENELPDDLIILKMHGNPCAEKKDYLKKIFDRIPHLEEIDGKEVTPVLKMVAQGKIPSNMLDYAGNVKELDKESENTNKTKTQNGREELKHEELYKGKSNGQLKRPSSQAIEGENDEISEEDEEEEEDAEGEEEEGDEGEEDEEEEEKEEAVGQSRRSEASLGFRTEGRTATSDLSTAYSRAEESTILDAGLGETDVSVLREKTDKLLKRMKERHAQQLGDAMQEIKESRALYDDIIKIYKAQEKKKCCS